jgi:dephospho-CoA kinase
MESRVFGLTGTIGSGKSTVAEIFRWLGAVIIDADLLAREVVQPGTEGLRQITKRFGKDVVLHDGTLNRKRLGEVVFGDPQLRGDLENIIHPKIRGVFLGRLKEARAAIPPPPVIIYVVPLLYESRFAYEELSGVIVVSSSRESCIARIMTRDSCTEDLAKRKLDSQIPIEKKETMADYVIHNEGPLDSLEEQVRAVFQTITTR